MSRHLLHKAMETINFQSKDFGKAIEEVVEEIKNFKGNAKELNKDKLKVKLEEVIKNYSGIKGDIDFNSDSPAVNLPVFTAGHLFFEDYFDTLQKKDSKQFYKAIEKHSNKNVIDIKNARISGTFSEIIIKFYFPLWFIKDKNISKEQVTAVILHEVGHAFTLFEYSNRMAITNQALALVSKAIMDKESDADRVIYLRKASEMITGNENSFKDYEKITNTAIITNVFMKATADRACSELKTDTYDFVACEYLADQYAARHGYARPLVEVLNGMHADFFNKELRHIPEIIFHLQSLITAFVSISIILNPISIIGTGVIGFVMYLISLLSVYSFMFCSKYTDRDYTYDDLFIRFKRNKEQVIQYIKNPNLDQDVKRKAIEDIETIEQIMKKTRQFENIFEKITLFFSKKSRDTKQLIELQYNLETLANNDLFVKAAKLTTLKPV